MAVLLQIAAALAVLIGIAHSYLGERFILIRLFRRDELPRLFGGTEFTRQTLRFAWHVTAIAWWGLAAVLVLLAHPPVTSADLGAAVGATFLITSGVALIASRGRHLSWPVFLAIGLLSVFATRG